MSRLAAFLSRFTVAAFVLILVVLDCGTVYAQKLRLRSHVDPACVAASGNPSWKYADIYADGKIAVQGGYNCSGAFIYDLSDPQNPVLASAYDPVPHQAFIEAVVVGNRGYFGSGGSNPGLPAQGDGVHIVDLTDPYHPLLLGKVDPAHGGGYPGIHEMMVWGKYLIENYNGTGVQAMKFIDVSNPANPFLKWNFNPTDFWVHAMHIRGNRMYTSGWGGRIDIFDLSNIDAQPPALIGSILGDARNHSTWTTEDGKYLYSCRETPDGDIRVYDVQNPSQPLLVRTITTSQLGLNAITPHNPTVVGNYLYVAWYQAGLQVFDISNPVDPKRVAQYDTFDTAFAPPVEELKVLASGEPWDVVCGAGKIQELLPNSYDGNWAVFPFLGQDKVLAGDMSTGLYVFDATSVASPVRNRVVDLDGDRKTDFSIFRPAGGDWEFAFSGSEPLTFLTHFGLSGDLMAPGDYNGDGRAELGVFRPSDGTWYIQQGGGYYGVRFGQSGDVPVPADYDADGRTDIAIFRPSNGSWYIYQSTLGVKVVQWGKAGDKAVTGDFEGDGKADIAVWRPENGIWYVLQSSSGQGLYLGWGQNGDRPLSVDLDGNGRTDFAVFRPSNGIWYAYDPGASPTYRGYTFGFGDDMPVPADYDGDGRSDIGVFRPTTRQWFWISSLSGAVNVRVFGEAGDEPAPSASQPK
jgi:hypothetical protein